MVRRAVGSRALVAPAPRWLLLLAARLLAPVVGDVVLTADEVEGLCANLLVSAGPPTGTTRFSEWLGAHARELGTTWACELDRHFRPPAAVAAAG
jgi:NADH dehydrogenase